MSKSPAALFGVVGHYRNPQPPQKPGFEDGGWWEGVKTAVFHIHTLLYLPKTRFWLTLLLTLCLGHS